MSFFHLMLKSVSLFQLIFSSPAVQSHYEQNCIQTKGFLKVMTVEQHYKSLPAKKPISLGKHGDTLYPEDWDIALFF